MKIALFTDSFLPGVGGTENATHHIALELSKEHEVMVLAPKYSKPFDDSALPYQVARAKSIKATENDFWAMPKITSSLKKAIADFKPDILHCQTMGMMAGFANSFGKKHNIPVLYTIHTKWRCCYRHALKSKLLAEILLHHVIRRTRKADCVCSVSNSMIEELKSYGVKQQPVIIKNGSIKSQSNIEKEKPSGNFQMLFVGLVTTMKNIDFSLKALSIIKKTRSDFTFKIVGRGPDVKKLKKLTSKLGLEDNVEFVGVVRDKELLNRYYSQADLFLFPSVCDSDGLVVLEAGNVGTPSIVIENTGAAERVIDNQTGFVCKYSVDAYAEKILSLMDKREYLQEIGSRADTMFTSWEDNAKQYAKLYQQLLEKRKN